MDFFYFLTLSWKMQGSISGNIRKAFFWEKIRNSLILDSEISIAWNTKNFFQDGFFFIFWAWVRLAAPCYTTSDIHDKQFLSFADELLGYYLKIVTHGLCFWSSFSWVNWKLKMRHSPNTSHSILNKRSRRRSRLSKLVLHYKFEEFWLLGDIS